MIGVCRKCGQCFETTMEDAYDPDGPLCVPCYKAAHPQPPQPVYNLEVPADLIGGDLLYIRANLINPTHKA